MNIPVIINNHMRNKELALRRIQSLQARFRVLRQTMGTGTKEEISDAMKQLHEILDDLQGIVEREN
jgi:prephenate dehydrogenase